MDDWRELTDDERRALDALRSEADATTLRLADTTDMPVHDFLRRLREVNHEAAWTRVGEWTVSRATYSWPGHKVRLTTFRTEPGEWIEDEAWMLFASAANHLELPEDASLETSEDEDDLGQDVLRTRNVVTVYLEEIQKPEMN